MRRVVLMVGLALAAGPLLPAHPARAQWVFLARKVIGRIEHMTQAPDPATSQPGYDVASVILDANPARVYATVIAGLKKHPELTIGQQDATHRRVAFSKGGQSASITVVSLGEDVSQLLIGSAIHSGESSATSQVVEGVLNVCRAMKKTCTVGD